MMPRSNQWARSTGAQAPLPDSTAPACISPCHPSQQGVCSGLRDVLENAARDQLAQHLPSLLPAIQVALCDPDPEVRLVS